MCGICGIVTGPGSSRVVRRDAVERMRDTILHRGPDGEGLFLEPGVGLGHRRLAIVDVARGAQPMASDDGRLQLIYNGEIYNHPQLMPELEQSGVRYHTHCDTETVLHLYEREGEAMPTAPARHVRLRDLGRRARELFLARDRFGVKPLYYVHLDDGTLVFGSEIKAILASGVVRAALNLNAVPDYLANHAPSGEETLFAGIKRLAAGSHAHLARRTRSRSRRYWDLHFGRRSSTDSAPTRAHRRVPRALPRGGAPAADGRRAARHVPLRRHRLGGDHGGDEPAGGRADQDVLRRIRRARGERARVRAPGGHALSHRSSRSRRSRPSDFFAALPRLVWHEDEPIAHPSSVALYFVSRLAAERVKVVLTGEGSDETLAGYNRYRVTLFNRRLGAPYEAAIPRAMRAAVRQGIDTLPAGGGLRRRLTRTFLSSPPTSIRSTSTTSPSSAGGVSTSLLAPAIADQLRGVDPYAAAHAALAQSDATTLLDRLLYADTKTYLHELLMKQDQMSMAASIESRVPFLDHPLVEFASSLPERLKLRGWTTKYVLRQAMRDLLAPEILSRAQDGLPGAGRRVVSRRVPRRRRRVRARRARDGARALPPRRRQAPRRKPQLGAREARRALVDAGELGDLAARVLRRGSAGGH